jgi:hypothetical protein
MKRMRANRSVQSRRKRQTHSYAHLAVAVVVVVAFSAFKWRMHDSAPMDWLRQQGFLILHKSLGLNDPRSRPLPVVLVDISRIEKRPESRYPGESPLTNFIRGKSFTDRRIIAELVRRVAGFGPRAVAIDIDLSPELDGTEPPPYHFELLELCHRLGTNGVPVFCGVGRAAGFRPGAWLGVEEYRSNAALTLRLPGNNSVMPSEIRHVSSGESLQAIGRKLADEYLRANPVPRKMPRLVKFLATAEREVAVEGVRNWKIQGFYVNYHFLGVLTNKSVGWIPAEEIVASTPGTPEDHSLNSVFRGKVVIFGEARGGETFDVACVPGGREPIPSVFLHGCATSTLISSPLTEMASLPGLLLSFFISAGFILFRERVVQRLTSRITHAAGEVLVNAAAVTTALLIAFALALRYNLLWLDVAAACVVFCLETYMMIFLLGIHWNKP